MKQMIIIAAMAVAACSQQPAPIADEAKSYEYTAPAAPKAVAARFDPATVEKAKALIAEGSTVRQIFFDDTNEVEWHIAAVDDGSKRYGYAGAVCLLLREAGAYDDEVDVRMIDAAKIGEFRDAYREYSLGGVRCKDEAQIW